VITNTVERFVAQIERREDNIGTPHGVVVSIFNVGRQGVFAGVTTGTVSTVVSERNSFRQCNVETKDARNGHSDLRNFESVRETSALMIIREDEDLGLACKAAK
jgi:hypothetical protein